MTTTTTPYNYLALQAISGGALRAIPGANVTVYLTGTTTKAALTNAAGVSISNPGIADSGGNFPFYIVDGTYDIIAQSGAAFSSMLTVSIGGISTLQAEITQLQASQYAGVVGFNTLAALNANLNYAANTIGNVLADPTPSNNGTYLKSGASGAGSWAPVSGALTLGSLAGRVTTLEGYPPLPFFSSPIIVESDRILIPGVNVFSSASGFAFVGPASSTGAYYAFSLGGFGSGAVLWYLANGAITQLAGPTAQYDVRGSTVIAAAQDGIVTSEFPCAGLGPLGSAPNQASFSRDATGATRLFGTTRLVDIASAGMTDPYLTAYGITKGVQDTAGLTPFYGDDFTDAELGQRAFFRIIVKSSVANAFGVPTVDVFDSGNSSVIQFALAMEQQINSTLAIFSGSFVLPIAGAYDAAWFYVGVNGLAGTGTIVQLQGLQYHCGPTPAWWIMRGDLDATAEPPHDLIPSMDPFYATDMFLVSGRPQALYPSNLMRDRSDGDTFVTTFWSEQDANAGYPQVLQSNGGSILVNPDKCGPTGGIDIRQRGGAGTRKAKRFRLPLKIHVAPSTQTGTVNILYIGDSISNRNGLAFLKTKLLAMGLTPNFVGTMINRGGVNGEAREGWSFSDFTGQRVRSPPFSSIAVGGESTYLAYADDGSGQTTAKLNYNPFWKTPTADDTANRNAYIFNGVIFDLQFYLARFAYSNPDFVIINLGQNDMAFASSTTVAQNWISNGLLILYNQIRRALPNANIAFLSNTQPRSRDGDAYYPRRPDLVFGQMLAFKSATVDTKLWVLPAWAHMSQETGWSTSLDATSNVGVQSRTITDGVHPDLTDTITQHQLAEVSAAFVAAVRAGV